MARRKYNVDKTAEIVEETKEELSEVKNTNEGCTNCLNTGFEGGVVGASTPLCSVCGGSPFGVEE